MLPHTIEVLGLDEDDNILIWSFANQELYKLRDFNAITRPKIIQMAGKAATYEFIRELDESESLAGVVKDSVAEECRKRRINHKDSLGVGVWPLSDRTLAIVTGGSHLVFSRQGDSVSCRIRTEPMVDGKLIVPGKSWLDLSALRASFEAIDPAYLKDIWRRLMSAFSCWKLSDIDRTILAGFIAATPLQAVWEFRPQVSVTGRSYSGKTKLREALSRMWPQAILRNGKTSAAGILGVVQRSSLPLILDEAEQWYGRQAILELLRNSTSGGIITKGTASGTTRDSQMSHMVWMIAIEDGLREEPDLNRFARFTLGPGMEYVHPEGLEQMGVDLLAGMMVLRDDVLALIARLRNTEGVHEFGRLADVYCLPVAIWAAFNASSDESACDLLFDVLKAKTSSLAADSESEELELLHAILHSIPRSANATVARLLKGGFNADEQLESAGIRKDIKGHSGEVFFAHKVLERHLGLGPRWANRRLADLLERLDGAKKSRQRINDVNEWGVLVPMTVIAPDDDNEVPF